MIRRLADRHTGVGFDQLLVVEAPYDPESAFHYRIFKADGSEVEQWGNGALFFAGFVRMKGLTNKYTIHVSTKKGKMVRNVEEEDLITVNMGVPEFEKNKIPFRAKQSENLHSACR